MVSTRRIAVRLKRARPRVAARVTMPAGAVAHHCVATASSRRSKVTAGRTDSVCSQRPSRRSRPSIPMPPRRKERGLILALVRPEMHRRIARGPGAQQVMQATETAGRAAARTSSACQCRSDTFSTIPTDVRQPRRLSDVAHVRGNMRLLSGPPTSPSSTFLWPGGARVH